ncbi:hypothetical protein AAC691_16940 [Nguyenibacter vanlangensis]|uniref:Uncharacterized protein n=1 Tax=Nguyenibacter vanlangensis TaxID=1216886 RepID=A0ABZ3D2L3_9PROT
MQPITPQALAAQQRIADFFTAQGVVAPVPMWRACRSGTRRRHSPADRPDNPVKFIGYINIANIMID